MTRSAEAKTRTFEIPLPEVELYYPYPKISEVPVVYRMCHKNTYITTFASIYLYTTIQSINGRHQRMKDVEKMVVLCYTSGRGISKLGLF